MVPRLAAASRNFVSCLRQVPPFFGSAFRRRCAGASEYGSANAGSKVEYDPARTDSQRRDSMVVPLTVFGGLLFVDFSPVRTKRGGKPDVQILFGKKWHLNQEANL